MWIGGGISGMGEIPILGVKAKGLTSLIRKIFYSGTEGFAYDPNDLTTMFQDAAGIVPVTAVGQPVGLMLDKSNGLVLGSELVDKTIVPSSWTLYGANTATSPDVNIVSLNYVDKTTLGLLILNAAKALNTDIRNSGWYEVSLDIKVPNGQVWIQVAEVPNNKAQLITPLESYKRVTWKILTGVSIPQIHVFGSAGTVPSSVLIKNISVKKLHGNHAFQTVSASRPILQRNDTTGAYYLAFDGVDDYLQTNNIDFTSTDKVSLFAGVQKLSDATRGVLVHTGSSTPNPGVLGNFDLEAPSFELKGYSVTLPGALGNFDAKNSTATAPHSAVLSAKLWQSAPSISSSIQLKVNNILAPVFGGGATLPGNFGNLPMCIGRRGGAALAFNGHIYSLIGIGRLTTDSETIALEKFIAKNTGVTLSV